MVKTSPSNAGDIDLTLDQGAKISLASLPKNQSTKQKQHGNNIVTNPIKTLKNGPYHKTNHKKPYREHL